MRYFIQYDTPNYLHGRVETRYWNQMMVTSSLRYDIKNDVDFRLSVFERKWVCK